MTVASKDPGIIARLDARTNHDAFRSRMRELAERLAHEFEAPVGLVDASREGWIERLAGDPEAFPTPNEIVKAAAEGGAAVDRVAIWRRDELETVEWLVIPVPSTRDTVVLAVIGFAAFRDPEGDSFWGAPIPEKALRAWGRSVQDQLRADALRDELGRSDSFTAYELRDRSLYDRLTKRMRVSDPPERFQRMSLASLRDELGVAVAAWVPSSDREHVVAAGKIEGFELDQCRELVPESTEDYIRLMNDPLASTCVGVERFLAVAVDDGPAAGWVILINPLDGRPLGGREIGLAQSVAILIGVQRVNARLYTDLKELLFGVIRALTSAIDAKDPYTSGHSERVARIAVRLAEELRISSNQRGDLYLMGLLHDIGKIGVDDSVLKKRGALTPDEYRQIQAHVQIGVQILSDLKKLHHLLPGVAHHHESFDGSGYPSGLVGEDIPLEARVLAVADAFDAMSSTRPYRRRLSPFQIDEIFRKGSGIQWDPKVVEALFSCREDVDRITQKGLGESLKQVVDETLGRNRS